MQFSDMVTRCETRFRDEDHDIYSADDWKGYLNDAYQDVQAACPFWPWAETKSTSLSAAVNTRTVALPTNVVRVLSILNATDDIVMTQIDGNATHLLVDPTEEAVGSPRRFRVFGANIEVYPLAEVTTALTVEYMLAGAELTADDDVPAFPAQFHRVLVEGALSKAYIDDDNPDLATAYAEAFSGLLDALKSDMLEPRGGRYPTIADGWWG